MVFDISNCLYQFSRYLQKERLYRIVPKFGLKMRSLDLKNGLEVRIDVHHMDLDLTWVLPCWQPEYFIFLALIINRLKFEESCRENFKSVFLLPLSCLHFKAIDEIIIQHKTRNNKKLKVESNQTTIGFNYMIKFLLNLAENYTGCHKLLG